MMTGFAASAIGLPRPPVIMAKIVTVIKTGACGI